MMQYERKMMIETIEIDMIERGVIERDEKLMIYFR